MIAISWIAAILVSGTPLDAGHAGVYDPDISKSPDKSGVLQSFFGTTKLCIQTDGTFHFSMIRMEGFWRREGDKIVLVYSGFFGRPYAIADAELRRKRPTSHLEGLVLSVEKDGALRLPEFGAVKGPVFFRRRTERTIRDLLRISQEFEPGSEDAREAEGEAAYWELADRIAKHLSEVIKTIGDPTVSVDHRGWAAILLQQRVKSEKAHLIAGALISVCKEPLSDRDKRRIARSLGGVLARSATEKEIPALLDALSQKFVSPSDVPKAMAVAGYKEGIPQIVRWLEDKSPYVRHESCAALGKLGAVSELPRIRKIAERDPEAQVRIFAYGAIARLTTDESEKDKAMHALAGLVGKTEFNDSDVCEQLGATHSKKAIPLLVAVLNGNVFNQSRAVAAAQLGKLGFTEALPALKRALKSKPSKAPSQDSSKERMDPALREAMEAAFSDADLDKAIVEAIWAIEHPAKK